METTFMQKMLSVLMLMMCSTLCGYSQIKTEDDGFVWEQFGNYEEGFGVKDANGKIIIPQSKDLSITYWQAKEGTVSIGYFGLTKWTGKKFIKGLADTNGKIIFPIKYALVWMGIQMCGNDTLAYFSATLDEGGKHTYYDINLKKLMSTQLDVEVGTDGYFHNFHTKESLGIKIPSANGCLSNYYSKRPSGVISTPLGDFFATEKNDEAFTWKLLSLSDGSICGAVSMDNKVLVPVSDRAHDIKYENGFFFGRQEGKDGKAFVYDSLGHPIISIADGHNYISRDVSTGRYFKATNFVENSTMNDVALYDLQGNLLIPIGNYYSINPEDYKGTSYFEVVMKNGSHAILDANLCPLISLSDKDIYKIEYRKDTLGIYYEIGKSFDDKQYVGILSENGTTVIPPNKYDLIDRIVTNSYAYYEVTVIKGKNYSDQKFLHGICDMSGREVIAPEYDYITGIGGKLEMKKGDLSYTSDIDISHPVRLQARQIDGLHYLLNSNGERINAVGYQTLSYDEATFSYTASIDGFQTKLSLSGSELTPILNQMFNKAYNVMETNPSEAIRLYTRIIELDKNDNYMGLKSQAANNIGYVYNGQGNKEKAIEYYRRALLFSPTNQIAQNNLDYMLHPPVEESVSEETSSEERMSGWDIAANLLGILNNALTNYSNIKSGQDNYGGSSSSYSSTRNVRKRNTQGVRSVSDVQNERTARRTYNNYVSQLIDMNTFRDRYNDSQRRNIQSSMRQIRQRWGFPKSEWEDWNGVK